MTVPLAKRVEVAERRAKVVQMRLAGLSYEVIAERLNIKGGARSASKDMTRALAAASKAQQESAEQLLDLEIKRLDRLMAALWPKALEGDVKAVETCEKLITRRTYLLGLDQMNRNGAQDGDMMSLLGALFDTLRNRHTPGEVVEAHVVSELEPGDDDLDDEDDG
ncbi:hypothetical protein [Streptosporangium saharense]|uniref:hypothetical protein n=1 Tax=Streptosporangium saharense TaxID=1706840 RepID=UPI00342AFEDB